MDEVKFCLTCEIKSCLKTKKICKRLDKWLKKHVEVKFWHGVEGFMDGPTLDFMQNKLYSIDNNEDMTEF